MLREIVRQMRAANERTADGAPSEGSAEAARKLDALMRNYRPSCAPLDAAAAVRELRDLTREPSPEVRYALARWIAGRIALKRGRKPAGATARRRASLPPLDAGLCIRTLLTFGSKSEPIGVHPNTRAALVDLLVGDRRLKRGPRIAPASAMRMVVAGDYARLYQSQGDSGSEAMRRAAEKFRVKLGTLQRQLVPRTVR